MKFRKIHLLLFSLLSGVLLSLAWPVRGFPGLLFIGLVPMLFIEDQVYRNKDRFISFSVFFYTLPGFLLWNLLTTWWICNSTLVGAIMAIFFNSIFLSTVFQVYHFSKKNLQGKITGYACLVVYWISFEYLHLNWDLNWPWLNLGNGFASYYKWVQWYEFTGALGGTLWILVANIFFYELVRAVLELRAGKEVADQKFKATSRLIISRFSAFLAVWILVPILISWFVYMNYTEEKRPVNFVVVQPNFDPYSEQYSVPPQVVINRIMKLGGPKLDSTTNFLVAPESAIQEEMWENDLNTFASVKILREIIRQHPDLNILVGGSTFHYFKPGEEVTRTARKFKDVNEYYDAYNTAIMINSRDSLQLYHKSKLTPGVEILPSFKGFNWLEKFAINLGGTVGSLGTDKVRKVYKTVNTVKVSPIICYESVFGEFFAEFVKNGAEVMIIITNDGWWGNTPGYKQHFSFAHLRAIETRRCIARSANTGISSFIDQRGDDHQSTQYWVPGVIKGSVNASSRLTFYVKHGDYIARITTWLTFILLPSAIILRFIRRKKKLAVK